ncbi:isoprenylcysteine carboxyl methyltransferase family protein [Halobacillus salinus]|uniref:isoprenylcysteine carboxyl methyltransferase family protein n=1 Tax=Halobacillus salinus TaxID=192814 RepID=UPI0009A8137E|nr:isoprenylcysteine carboxylmethyltransferase family protein [Halobacillus salinus]
MDWLLIGLFSFLIFQRLSELAIAKSNKKWMLERGGREIGQEHYFLFILLHTLFFVSILVEFSLTDFSWSYVTWIALTFFSFLQLLRIYCIATLGRRWNTRIIIIPEEKPIQKGLYRFMSHPNYTIVFFELIAIPLLFHAYITAVIFPVFHLLILRIRIPAENRALKERA